MAKCPCENRLLDCAGVNSEAAKLHFATEHVYTSVGNPADRSLINRSHYQATFMYACYTIHITTLYVLYSVLLDIHGLSKTTILRVSLVEPNPTPTACIAVPYRTIPHFTPFPYFSYPWHLLSTIFTMLSLTSRYGYIVDQLYYSSSCHL